MDKPFNFVGWGEGKNAQIYFVTYNTPVIDLQQHALFM